MGKLLLLFALACLTTLIVGTTFAPNSPAFWLASSSSGYMHVREILAAILFIQYVTNPPRKMWFRLITTVVTTGTALWALLATYNNQMLFLDTLGFLIAAVAIGLTTLETRPAPIKYYLPDRKKS